VTFSSPLVSIKTVSSLEIPNVIHVIFNSKRDKTQHESDKHLGRKCTTKNHSRDDARGFLFRFNETQNLEMS
jgi:hypothetical protein